ncbi:MAG: Mor transcription activator family protein [Rhodanobacter sp.]
MAYLDLVADILERVGTHIKLPAKVAQAVEREVRDDWGGERHYVAKVGESGKAMMAERDQRIRAEYHQGEHVELLARRHGISVKRVQQIVANDAGNALP